MHRRSQIRHQGLAAAFFEASGSAATVRSGLPKKVAGLYTSVSPSTSEKGCTQQKHGALNLLDFGFLQLGSVQFFAFSAHSCALQRDMLST